jgi:porphobilinogen synthase
MTDQPLPNFPAARPRRLRATPALRRLVRETRVTADSLVMPLFVRGGKGVRRPIDSMPGNFQLSVDELVKEARVIQKLGVPAILLFGLPDRKDAKASGAYARHGIVQTAVRAVKDAAPELLVITDVCNCEYTDHGHCGIVGRRRDGALDVDNDATLKLLARSAVSHAEAGANLVAPSDMMDGRVAAIRRALDKAGFTNTPIMSYAAKFASGFYGPFREAADSPPQFGDRRTYQMNYANGDEALREVALDIAEGADIVMVKPALAYLDLVRRVKERFGLPTAVYNVSGEFSMVKAAAEKGWLDERAIVMEMMTAFRRAGADIIITYWAKDVARWLAS